MSYRDDEDPVSLRCLCDKVEDDGRLKRVVAHREFCPTLRMRSPLAGGSETCQRSSGGPNRQQPTAGEPGRTGTLQTWGAPLLTMSSASLRQWCPQEPELHRTRGGGRAGGQAEDGWPAGNDA